MQFLPFIISLFFYSPTTVSTIDVQPFGTISSIQVNYVYKELKKVYPSVDLKKTVPLPFFTYYRPRNRYRADSLLRYLNPRTQSGHVTIGITNRDISTTKNEIKDWGIMGLGYQPGNACIVSTYRLSTSNTKEQLYKVAVHEAGHCFGLSHCPVEGCLMQNANGKNHLDQETGFCNKCKEYLNSKGWKL